MSPSLRRTTLRLLLALAAGLALVFLPLVLTLGVGQGIDLSGKLALAGGVGAGTFAVLFAAGVLTSLTPCVYPLIPITVGLFGARAEAHRGRSAALSATYVAGIAVMFSALGLFAALSGKAFGAALSSPWVVALLAAFFLALAASLFGAFELTLPAPLQARVASVRSTGFAGAFGMGLVAGVVAAPCTGPVLAAVLAFVAATRSALLGFWMLFAYALGVGLPFFVLGATSVRLPRSGPWMETVKSVLGVALVAAGIGLLLPLLPRPPALPMGDRAAAAGAAVLAFAAVLLGALSLSFHGGAREKWQKGGALAVLLLAVGLRLGWTDGAKVPAIPWLHDEAAAVAQARSTGKPLLIDFFAEWCAACKELDVHTFSDPKVAKEVVEKFVPLKVDATDENEAIDRLTAKYRVPGLPTVLLMACKDDPPKPKQQAECQVPFDGPGRITGFVPADDMLARMRRFE